MFLFLGEKLLFLLQDLSQKLLSLFLWKLCYLIPHHLKVIKMLEIKIISTYLKPIINDDEINTSNVRVGFSEKKQLSNEYAVCGTGSKQGQKKVNKTRFDTEGPC